MSSNIDTPNKDFVKIYGSHGKAHIVLEEFGEVVLDVFNLDGKKVINQVKLTSNTTEIDLTMSKLFFIKVSNKERSITKMISTF